MIREIFVSSNGLYRGEFKVEKDDARGVSMKFVVHNVDKESSVLLQNIVSEIMDRNNFTTRRDFRKRNIEIRSRTRPEKKFKYVWDNQQRRGKHGNIG